MPPSPQKAEEKKEQSQRILGVVPAFETTSLQHPTPLSVRQKYRLFARQSFDPAEFAVAGVQAGISQASEEFHDYGQGAEGYGKRYGATFADQVSSSFFSNAFYPALFHQDPRFFRQGSGPVNARITHALVEEFWAHQDSGGRGVHWSNLLGAFTAGGISNTYYPESDRGFGLTMSRSAIALGYGSLGGLAQEFWPDVQKRFFSRKNKKAVTP